MSYSIQATNKTPALIIYLIDVSASMLSPMGDRRRIDVVMDSIAAARKQMIFRSTKGSRISPRYRVAIYAYGDMVVDVLGGVKGIDQLARFPDLTSDMMIQKLTNTGRGFAQVERLLQKELPKMQDCPAPVVCHLTDGAYSIGDDPAPIVKRIMQMSNPDGNVLVENIFIGDEVLAEPIEDIKHWGGIMYDTPLKDKEVDKLKNMSSIIPASYLDMMRESNYRLKDGALMMFPAQNSELVSLGFQMSAATPIR